MERKSKKRYITSTFKQSIPFFPSVPQFYPAAYLSILLASAHPPYEPLSRYSTAPCTLPPLLLNA